MQDIRKGIRKAIVGAPRDLNDKKIFSSISLVVFLAWVGLGSDPLSSSCYGPEEIYRHLQGHTNLSIIVGLLTVFTIFIISSSYSQIIKLFPSGGGGYIVASKLISPSVGMVSGSALLIDYVLTISISISSGSDAIFSFLPSQYHHYKIFFAFTILALLTLMNSRGVKESVLALTPIFIIFILTHAFLIIYAISTHSSQFAHVYERTSVDFTNSISELGIFGTIFIILKAFSMGAGTYTGIEAVSNGIPNLREPRAQTAIKTMRLLAISLSVAVIGLIISYYLYDVKFSPGKTLNAVLTESLTASWSPITGNIFLYVTLISEAALLFVAAQTGFLDGPRVMANMAQDYWMPRQFTLLSDRLVSQNGILLIGFSAFLVLLLSGASVSFLVVLYSINVFITFSLSQFGMILHWISARKTEKKWFRKLLINTLGFSITFLILISVTIIKFHEGGWITLLITGSVITIAILIKRHYKIIGIKVVNIQRFMNKSLPKIIEDLKSKVDVNEVKQNPDNTAVMLVNGYSGIGLYSLLYILEKFPHSYNKFIFMQVGIVQSTNLKGHDELMEFNQKIELELKKYVYLVNKLGYEADFVIKLGTDVSEEVVNSIPEIEKIGKNITFIGGQLIFSNSAEMSRILHNYTIFSIQKRLYKLGITTTIIPIKFENPTHLLT